MTHDLGHPSPLVPGWVKTGEAYHIRIRAESFSTLPLTDKQLAPALLKSATLYHDIARWYCHLFLLMPDHLHALLVFPPNRKMNEVIGDWKTAQAKQLKIQWQGNFYEEMVSHGRELEEKAAHIRRNPIVRRLCAKEETWPWAISHPV